LLKPVQPARLAQTIEHLHEMALLQSRAASVVLGDHRSWEKIPVEAIAASLRRVDVPSSSIDRKIDFPEE
jgi:hypothetical protein